MEESVTIEFAADTIAKLIGYSYNILQSPDLDNTTKFLWTSLYDQLYKEKSLLYSGSDDIVKSVIERVENVYCPFLKNELFKS